MYVHNIYIYVYIYIYISKYKKSKLYINNLNTYKEVASVLVYTC